MELKRIIYFKYRIIHRSFNRTLWNWNNYITDDKGMNSIVLIVPYGIETADKLFSQITDLAF